VNVDDVRRAWTAATEASGTVARLVAIGAEDGVMPVRGRTAAAWSERLAFERAFADELSDGVGRVDLQWLAPAPKGSAADRARGKLGLVPKGPATVGARAGAGGGGKRAPAPAVPVPGVKQVLAVASGKGGVGKSTVAVNLALGLKAQGLKVGLLDADVYGPSIPTMLGSFSAPTREDGVFTPPTAQGLPFLSLGLMVNPDRSVIWRGPMVQRMVRDMLQSTAWPDLDVLVIDLPPGTGDVQLTLMQKALVTAAVVVTTPQDIALIDAARGLHMFEQLDVPVLGIVENMATYHCPSCGEASHPFGQDGGRKEAEKRGLPLLARVPLENAVRSGGDDGRPVILAAPDSASAKALAGLAESVAAGLADLAKSS
jgi:ATP-binding protein involved in chromosome partitioning